MDREMRKLQSTSQGTREAGGRFGTGDRDGGFFWEVGGALAKLVLCKATTAGCGAGSEVPSDALR